MPRWHDTVLVHGFGSQSCLVTCKGSSLGLLDELLGGGMKETWLCRGGSKSKYNPEGQNDWK